MLFDGLRSDQGDDDVLCSDRVLDSDEDDYSDSEFDDVAYEGTSDIEMTPAHSFNFPARTAGMGTSKIAVRPPADVQSLPSNAPASSILEDTFSYCSLDESSVMVRSVAEESDVACSSRNNSLHDSSVFDAVDEDEDDSYAVDEWEEEDESTSEVQRLAHLLNGTDLRQEIRDELRRCLDE